MAASAKSKVEAESKAYAKSEGVGAWEVKDSWNKENTKAYHETATAFMDALQKSGNRYSCEDFALATVMAFSKSRSLPFKWKTGSQSFDAATWNNPMGSFQNAVMKASGAKDFQRSENTSGISLNEAQKGDIIILKNSKDVAHHVQMIYGIDGDNMDIRQGNMYQLAPIDKKVESATFNTKTGDYNNLTDPNPSGTTDLYKQNIEFRTFNFGKWK